MADGKPLDRLAKSSCEVPAPPEAKKKKKSKGKKGFNEEEDLERQKHDLGLLFNNPADRAKVRKKRASEITQDLQLEPEVQEILETLRSDPAWREEGEAEGQAGHLQLQEAVKLLSAQLSERARQVTAAEEASGGLRKKLELMSSERQQLEREKAEAVQKMEEMELEMLKKKQEDGKDKHSASGAPDLEKLLKDALVHGAKLSRAKKDLEEQRLELRAEVQHLQRRVATLSEDQAQHLQQKARQKERLEKLKAKIEQKQEEVDELETAVEDAEERADQLETRMAEYLHRQTSGANAVLEAHLAHVVKGGQQLQAKVEEQEEIIEVLRRLLQNHKDFIREQLGSELRLPEGAGQGDVEVVTRM
ncbi:unnamed protein product [Durusdinium trenchii]|uniref:Uncharacterized protein n=1 Tax=Durusdinium trenchii TaxID=1381693 RepID=A0ABP0NJU2_9DINO